MINPREIKALEVIALDLEGTLISNAFSQISRPGLYDFLINCEILANKIVIYTAVNEKKFREITRTLLSEKFVPNWFVDIDYINWHGPYKNILNIQKSTLKNTLIVDDYENYIKPDQKSRWIKTENFASPYSTEDTELDNALKKIKSLIKSF